MNDSRHGPRPLHNGRGEGRIPALPYGGERDFLFFSLERKAFLLRESGTSLTMFWMRRFFLGGGIIPSWDDFLVGPRWPQPPGFVLGGGEDPHGREELLLFSIQKKESFPSAERMISHGY